jgi:ribonuclease E
VEALDPAAEHEAEFEEAISSVHDAELQEATELPEPEFHETTAEYEPEDNASASFRVDPAGAREFRQSGAVEEPVVESGHEHVVESGHEPEFTSLQPTGELISEVAHAEIVHPDPTAPIEHEAVVQSVHAAAAETPVAIEGERVHAQESAGGFAPGDGQLEEELLDEEDAEIGSLHAGAFDDDVEEETLEGAADLGSMIRDMTIDDITGLEPAEIDEEDDEDEDEDFDDEEEDFEEDELASNGEDDFVEEEVSGSQISEAEEEEFAEASSFDENGDARAATAEGEPAREGQREGSREGGREGGRRGRRDGRRGGRDRGERSSSGERSGNSGDRGGERSSRDGRGMAGSRPRGGGRDRGGRSMQSTNLPAISDLLKPGQEVLVQIAKEPIAKKGARITSHIALPGRFLVFMPTVNHTGVSRKIESDGERRRLKEILLSEKGDAQGGFIVRTAAAGATEEELRSDLRFLLNLWADIKTRSESSKSPALIYHDLNLIERILRDQVTDNFSAIWVDTEAEYERVLRFLQRFQPSLIRRVKLYTKDTPLFEQFGITEEINTALRSKVWLKSGGSIVINQTEALVAIDINTGKYVGKTARLEDTIVKTNLDAIPEIVRQIRLRDLGGIIIIDFIDMDERKNRNKVMAALEDELKKDRAPSKVLQFNDFGLVAITRKRVKQSLERTLSTTCGICAGTGMVKSPVTVCNDIYIEMRKMHKLIEKGDIMLRVNPEVVKQLKTGGAKWLQEMEEMSGKTILVKSDPSLHPEQFDIH